jgi:hypothetical protein
MILGMAWRSRPIVLGTIALFVAACGGTGADAPGRLAGGFPGYPSAERWCTGTVFGNFEDGTAVHIDWQAFTTSDPPDEVASYYEDLLGEAEGRSWRRTRNGSESSLQITDADAPPPPTSECSEEIPEDAETVLFVSTSSGVE